MGQGTQFNVGHLQGAGGGHWNAFKSGSFLLHFLHFLHFLHSWEPLEFMNESEKGMKLLLSDLRAKYMTAKCILKRACLQRKFCIYLSMIDDDSQSLCTWHCISFVRHILPFFMRTRTILIQNVVCTCSKLTMKSYIFRFNYESFRLYVSYRTWNNKNMWQDLGSESLEMKKQRRTAPNDPNKTECTNIEAL